MKHKTMPPGHRSYNDSFAHEGTPLFAAKGQKPPISELCRWLKIGFEVATVPFIVFALSGLVVAFFFDILAIALVTTTFFLVVISLGAALWNRLHGRFFWAFRFAMLGVAGLLGFLQGYYNYCLNASGFWDLTWRREYANVLPDDPATAHQDAAVFFFVSDARPDSRYVASYRNSETTYCAAPVIMREAVTVKSVQYWAVGRDCCFSGSFACDSAKDDVARAAVVVTNRTNPFSAFVRDDVRMYEMAVEMAQAKFGLSTSDQALFVRWMRNVSTAKREFLSQVAFTWLKAVLLCAPIFLCVASLPLALGWKKWLEPLEENLADVRF